MSGQERNNNVSRLAREMRARQISSSKLSLMTGIGQHSIVRYRTGQVLPRDYFDQPTPNALIIARALQVDVDELFPPRDRATAA